jgi:hypothetical protein
MPQHKLLHYFLIVLVQIVNEMGLQKMFIDPVNGYISLSIGEAISRKCTFRLWARAVISLKIQCHRFYLERWSTYVFEIYLQSFLKKKRKSFCFWDPSMFTYQ